MKRQIHVHIHRSPTRDAVPEGRWVTINGARVFIGKGGEIEKGPAALVGKSATGAHLDASQHHKEQASTKGEKHGDFGHHLNAMHSHTGAAIHANKPMSEEYGKHADAAAEHEAKLRTVHTSKPKPKSHQKLHEETAAAVAERGDAQHKATHERLAAQYEEADADWKRASINRQMEHNMVSANQRHADLTEKSARATSARAHATGTHEDHLAAAQHLDEARAAVGKYGGVGYAAKQDELHRMRKGHETAASGTQPIPPDAPMSGEKAREHAHFAVETDKGTEYVSVKAVNGTGVGITSAHTDELADHLSGKPKKSGEVNVRPGNKVKEGANAHKLLDPGTKALMGSGQRALSGVPPGKKK